MSRSQEVLHRRYATVFERLTVMSNTSFYIKDLDGCLHDLSESPEKKLETAEKSLDHWAYKLADDPKNEKAIHFVEKFTHLVNQINIYLGNKKDYYKEFVI